MQKDVILNPRQTGNTLSPLFVGYEQCKPSHRYGPHVRSHYLIHFCLTGCGTLQDKNGTHSIKAGELFVIRPDEVTVYEADNNTPWQYCWIAFVGEAAKPFDTAPSVLACPEELDTRFLSFIRAGEQSPAIYLSLLFELLYHLFESSASQIPKGGLSEICQYIQYNYMQPLQVGDLAAMFGYERSYLYRLFKNQLGIGVKEYITATRMDKARQFLLLGHSVCDTARMVGFADEFNFSKSYKKHFGTPPSTDKRTVGR